MTYAFTFDSSSCSGCKACQIACKDKNNLPVGVLWRRVYEVSGGSWQKQNEAWVTDVFAYNLSIACSHCVHPKCAGVCPTDAYVVREDGIVYIDGSRCMGCGYCAWACPYAVPQYNPELRQMTKCNFCMDNLEIGLPPACVAACPLRVLEFEEFRETKAESAESDYLALWLVPGVQHPFPLPEYSRTEPHLTLKPHAGMLNALEKAVSNREEIKPARFKSELPLVVFTLFIQMAAGMAVFSLFGGALSAPVLSALGALIGIAGLASLFHLGAPLKAWRALSHLNKSWLSREILMFGLFGLGWLLSLFLPGMGKLPLALCGIGLLYSMAQVYRLRSLPAWDTNRTLLAFIVSAMVLGGLGLVVLDVFGAIIPKSGYLLASGTGLAGTILLLHSDQRDVHQATRRLRPALILVAFIGLVIVYSTPGAIGSWVTVPTFIVAMVEEAIGRWSFYEHLHRRVM